MWYRDRHTLISLVSTSKVEDLIAKTGLFRNSVFKLICLPPISRRGGCALLQLAPVPSPISTTINGSDESYDDDNDHDTIIGVDAASPSPSSNTNLKEDHIVKSIMNALGGYVECRDDKMMEAMMITTAMMGPIYGVMRNNREWLGEFV